MSILTDLKVERPDGEIMRECLAEQLPGHLRERLGDIEVSSTEPNTILRSCAFVAAIVGPEKLSVAGARRGERDVEITIGKGFTLDLAQPETAYICTDGAYQAWMAAHKMNPRAVDDAAWPDIVARVLDAQRLGTVANDDIALVRFKMS